MIFLDMTPNTGKKWKTDKLDSTKIKTVYESIALLYMNRVKKYPEWQKIFANYISDKGLISRVYKDS